MKFLVLGAAGMLARELALYLQCVGHIQGNDISELVLADALPRSVDAHAV